MGSERPILFLDIDGVLNNTPYMQKRGSGGVICPDNCDQLTRILAAVNCDVVLSSSWRYMVHRGAVGLRGFEHLLHTHGVKGLANRLVGITRLDEAGDDVRAAQVRDWLDENRPGARYVVLDDDDMGFTEARMPLVRTCALFGLTAYDADTVIAQFRFGEGDTATKRLQEAIALLRATTLPGCILDVDVADRIAAFLAESEVA